MTARISFRSQLMTQSAFKDHDACGKISLRLSEAEMHRQILDATIRTLEIFEGKEALIRGLIEFPDIAETALAEIKRRRAA